MFSQLVNVNELPLALNVDTFYSLIRIKRHMITPSIVCKAF